MTRQDYRGATKALTKIDGSQINEEIRSLLSQAEHRAKRVDELQQTIDSRLASKTLHGLHATVEELLTLQTSQKMSALRDKLQSREEKNAAQVANVIEKALGLREECRFEAASNALGRIPQELMTQEASDLIEDCGHLGGQRKTAMRALKSAMDAENYEPGLAKTKEYRDSLENESLDDFEFSRALADCQLALREQRAAEEAAERRQALMRKLTIAGAAVTAVALLIAAGLWIRSSMNATALADAVEQQHWDEALAIDGQDVNALVGRANQRLSSATPDIEGAFEDIELAEQVDLTNSEIKPVKAQAHAKRAASLATEGKIADAEKDLKEAETLDASDSALTPARQLLAAAYVTQAEAAVARSDVAEIRAACDSAERYQVAANDLNRLRAAAFKAEGEQKENSGDLSGAVAALEEAVKLDSSLGLTTERAVLHVTLGQLAVAKQDYQTAATHLGAAVTLDKSASGIAKLAAAIVEPVMAAFESDASAANQAAAIAAFLSVAQLDSTAAATEQLKSQLISLLGRPVTAFESDASAEKQAAAMAAVKAIESIDSQNSRLPALRGRLSATVIKRGEASVVTDLDAGLADYEQALHMGAFGKDVASLKSSVVSALQSRCRASLTARDAVKAAADYRALAKVKSQAADGVIAMFAELPVNTLSELPVDILNRLPADVLSPLSVDILSQLLPQVLGKLPTHVIVKLPGSVLADVPPKSNSLGMSFKVVPGGSFTMSSGTAQFTNGTLVLGAEEHKVIVSTFEVGVHEVTQEQFESVMNMNPSDFRFANNPINSVTQADAIAFCKKLSQLPDERAAGYIYDLPTRAQWEYACLAGATTSYSFGNNAADLGLYEWFKENSGGLPHAVGQKRPNAWGLYDMQGNVSEWCKDTEVDPTGNYKGKHPIYMGGNWDLNAVSCRATTRTAMVYYPGNSQYNINHLGLRVVRRATDRGKQQ